MNYNSDLYIIEWYDNLFGYFEYCRGYLISIQFSLHVLALTWNSFICSFWKLVKIVVKKLLRIWIQLIQLIVIILRYSSLPCSYKGGISTTLKAKARLATKLNKFKLWKRWSSIPLYLLYCFFHIHNSALSTDTKAAWITCSTVIFSKLVIMMFLTCLNYPGANHYDDEEWVIVLTPSS